MNTRLAALPLVLVVDDAEGGAAVAATLETTGDYAAIPVRTIAAAEVALAQSQFGFEGILLNATLSDGDGIELLARWRAQGIATPAIVLDGSGDERNLVRALRTGADDFLRKPFSATELLARLQARLRSFAASRDVAIKLGRHLFQPSRRMLHDLETNARVTLAEKEAKLLSHLYHSGGELMTRLTLLHAIWGYSSNASTHTVETHVYRLRQKIEDEPARPRLIVTERGGYRMVLPKADRGQALSFPLSGRAVDAAKLQ